MQNVSESISISRLGENSLFPAPSKEPQQVVKFAVQQVKGQEEFWNSTEKRQLTYCVNTSLGNDYHQMMVEMWATWGAWEAVANVDFIHVAGQDARHPATNSNVVFDMRPVNGNGRYLVRSFFPNDLRASMNVLVDNSSLGYDPNGKLS